MKNINGIDDFPANARIALYGAGDYGLALLELFSQTRLDVDVVCLVDTFKTGERAGRKIVRPEALVPIHDKLDFVLITSFAYATAIRENLEQLGIDNYRFLSPVFDNGRGSQEKEIGAAVDNGAILYAFYDLAVSPPGFDILLFLFLAEIERRRKNCREIHPVIVPCPSDMLTRKGFNYESGLLRDREETAWWQRNIIVPCCWMLPACRQITVCTSREEAARFQETIAEDIYPAGYQVTYPVEGYSWQKVFAAVAENNELPSLRATGQALKYVNQWLDNQGRRKKIITITLKEAGALAERDSNLEAWCSFARGLDPGQYQPVFVRDTGAALTPVPSGLQDLLVFAEVSWNMELRMALYELSYINMFVAGGPAELCQFNRKTRSIVFKVANSCNFIFSELHLESMGFCTGRNYPNATPYQIAVWEEDSLPRIEEEFAKLCALIENNPAR